MQGLAAGWAREILQAIYRLVLALVNSGSTILELRDQEYPFQRTNFLNLKPEIGKV